MQTHTASQHVAAPAPSLSTGGPTPGHGSGVWPAVSLGRPVARLAQSGTVHLSLLSQHRRVVNLITPQGDLVAIVDGTVGPGPFNVVLAAGSRFDALAVWAGHGCLDAERLVLGSQVIALDQAALWNPEPDWSALAQAPTLADGLYHLAVWFGQQRLPATGPLERRAVAAAQQAIAQVVTPADAHDRLAGLICLLGLGPGLTPLGDDWLSGWLLRRRLRTAGDAPPADLPGHHSADMITVCLIEQAVVRTTRLSQAWLRAAAAGWVDAGWLQLLHELARGRANGITDAAAHVLSHGATSGYTMLAGFLQERLV